MFFQYFGLDYHKTIQCSSIVKLDIPSCNAVIHLIDQVLYIFGVRIHTPWFLILLWSLIMPTKYVHQSQKKKYQQTNIAFIWTKGCHHNPAFIYVVTSHACASGTDSTDWNCDRCAGFGQTLFRVFENDKKFRIGW